MSRILNAVDTAKLTEANENVSAQKLALALLLLDADGRLDQFEDLPWSALPPMFRWMAHELLVNNELRARIIRILRLPDGQRPAETQTDST